MNEFKVPIQNILYIYSYVWEKVNINLKDLVEIDCQDDYDSSNIYAQLFLINVGSILKRGLYKTYIEKSEEIRGIKGKIDFKTSLNHMSFANAKAYCIYDEFEVNNIFNQIIKSTTLKLYRLDNLSLDLKKKLKNILLYFEQIDIINVNSQVFKKLRFNKNNMYYYLIIKICELINDSIMPSDEKGNYKFINLFEDESKFDKIFEKYVNRFYKKALFKEYKVYYQKRIDWNFFESESNDDMLPLMELDTVLESKEETIVIDTKYYKKFYDINQYNQKKFISEHLYQMYAYLSNYPCNNSLRGIILYPMPKTGEIIDKTYKFNRVFNNHTSVCSLRIVTIDLTKYWKEIEKDLVKIINNN